MGCGGAVDKVLALKTKVSGFKPGAKNRFCCPFQMLIRRLNHTFSSVLDMSVWLESKLQGLKTERCEFKPSTEHFHHASKF